MNCHRILFISLFTVNFAFAQSSDSYEESIEETIEFSQYPIDPRQVSQKKGYDTEQINVIRFDKEKWNDVVGNTNYTEEQRKIKRKQQMNDSISSPHSKSDKRFKRGEHGEESDSESNSSISLPIGGPIVKVVFYTLIFGLIAYILIEVIKNTSLKSKNKILNTDHADAPEQMTDIKELEVDRLLNDAVASGNYRLAIRICFLGLLKKLDEDNLIVWKKDKTNRDYLSELFSKEHYFEEVRNLTFTYEQVWYGDHTFSMQTYEEIISSFKVLNKQLNDSKPGEK